MNFPHPFEYLAAEPGPVILREALAHFALHEIAGPSSHPTIMAWAKEVGASSYYHNDDTPWCALFMAHCAKVAGFALPPDPLAAKSWSVFGQPAPKGVAMLGDIVVKNRAGGGGHVGLYVGETKTHYAVLGGNQANQVCIAWFPKSVFTHIRRCKWKVSQPANVRRIVLNAPTAAGVSES
ncbi:TIGR02594 family protein [Hymenobacter busanensis]|uniref:TIGR02594 family protein n=1 Tax=Hymenobacter busanensis TaxID=2607656 RepID=A0A7L4ZXY6_9BACT|nr:TIGR02594 family protein [Hymenobacter busanensis]KAA9333422.1 TIGR02594 family protein [Hymenobacter busanensis]QHJ07897.1 TIGR02594 family protein [Hymenobacter busanensis]